MLGVTTGLECPKDVHIIATATDRSPPPAYAGSGVFHGSLKQDTHTSTILGGT